MGTDSKYKKLDLSVEFWCQWKDTPLRGFVKTSPPKSLRDFGTGSDLFAKAMPPACFPHAKRPLVQVPKKTKKLDLKIKLLVQMEGHAAARLCEDLATQIPPGFRYRLGPFR